MRKHCALAVCLLASSLLTVSIAADKKPEITQITIERRPSGTYPESPQDTVILRSDGTALYAGSKNVERIGRFSGSLPKHYFGPTFENLTEIYMSFRGKGVSTGKPTSHITVITISVIVEGKEETIVDHCPGIDHRLFSMEMAVLGSSGYQVEETGSQIVPNKRIECICTYRAKHSF